MALSFKFDVDKNLYQNVLKHFLSTSEIAEIVDKASDVAGYPGLGYIKKLSIKNHLELIDRLITE